MDALAYIKAAGALLAGITAIVPQVTTLIDSLRAVASGREPTEADWDALHALEARNTAILNAPMEGEDQ